MEKQNNKVGLIILDGWGYGDHSESNAVLHAKTPNMDNLLKNYPNAQLRTDGLEVGLPDGQMGNSEVGHLNIGAGRIVYQQLTRINKSIKDGEFFQNNSLSKLFQKAKKEDKKVHFIGLVSKGGVHSAQEHLYALCDMAENYGINKSYIHAFTDGRDCDPHSGEMYFSELEDYIKDKPTQIASVSGRYYAMDRDNRWERIEKAYKAMVLADGKKSTSAISAIKESYQEKITDEFIEPTVITKDNSPIATIDNNDIVICFNFRTDRCREISIALTQKDFPEYNMRKLVLDYYTMTNYDKNFKDVTVIFEKEDLKNTLGEVLSRENKTQVRIAETEKYPHVTFFFSGGREKEFNNEKRLLVNSPKVATYDLQPEMSADQVTESILGEMKENTPDFFCLNFANPDMVGHTGVFEAIVKAVEKVDESLGKINHLANELGYTLLVIADHGNAEKTANKDGSPHTAHTTNPVPVVITSNKYKDLKNGRLADVAPTILDLLSIDKPNEMTGDSILKS